MEEPEKIENIFMIRTLVCIGILVVAAGITFMFASLNIEPPTHKMDEAIKILEGEAVKIGDIRLEVTGYGTAEPINEIMLSAEIKGRITTTNKDLFIGMVVNKGDTLATIDTSDYKLGVMEAKAALVQLQEEQKLLQQVIDDLTSELKTENDVFKLTENSWKRRSKLLDKRAVSQEEYENSRQAYSKQELAIIKVGAAIAQGKIRMKVNEAKIASAEAALDQANVNLRRSVVKAPFTGRLTKVFVDDGEYVTPGTQLCELADDSSFEIPVSLDAKIASKVFDLHLAQQKDGAWFSIPQGVDIMIEWPESPDNCRWNGKIKRVKKFDPETRTLILIVTPTTQCKSKGEKFPLVAGMFCRVIFKGRTLKNAVKIPWVALQLNDKIAVVNKESRLSERKADIVLVNEDNIILAGGIEPGEQIITQRLPRGIVNGMKIKIFTPEKQEKKVPRPELHKVLEQKYPVKTISIAPKTKTSRRKTSAE